MGTPLQGFNPYPNAHISFVGSQTNIEDYHDENALLSTLSTGDIDISQIRRYTSYKGSTNITAILESYFDGSTSQKNAKINPWNISQPVTKKPIYIITHLTHRSKELTE